MTDVRDVFDRLVADPPSPLPSAEDMLTTVRRARHRRRGVLVAGAAGLAVVAVVGAVAAGVPRPALSGTEVTPAAPGSPAHAAPAPARQDLPRIVPVPLRFRPTWVPAGWAEHGRTVRFTEPSAGAVRGWAKGSVDVTGGELKGARFELSPRKARDARDPAVSDGMANPGTPVDIGGKAGFLHSTDGKAYVEWRADADTVLALQRWGNELTDQDLLRIARSVQPDPAHLRIPLELGALPTDMAAGGAEFVGNSPTSWHVRVGVYDASAFAPPSPVPVRKDAAASVVRSMDVSVGTVTNAPAGGETLTVAGHPARLVNSSAAGGQIQVPMLVVDLGGGLLLTVSGMHVSRADLVTTAERVRVDTTPDLSWIGVR